MKRLWVIHVKIREGWEGAGKNGVQLRPPVLVGGQSWTPVLWDGEDDPDFHKTDGLYTWRERA